MLLRMSSHDELLAEIEAFLTRSGVSATTFGNRCVNDGKLVPRLRSGSSVTLPTADHIRDFIAEHTPAEPSRKRRAA